MLYFLIKQMMSKINVFKYETATLTSQNIKVIFTFEMDYSLAI